MSALHGDGGCFDEKEEKREVKKRLLKTIWICQSQTLALKSAVNRAKGMSDIIIKKGEQFKIIRMEKK